MLDHLLRYLEICDDAVAQRPDRLNVARGAADHQFRLLSDGEDLSLAPDVRDCDHRRLIQDDTAPFHVDDGVCRAEVDRHVGRQQTQHSCKHLTANPIEKTSTSLSDWPAISKWPAETEPGEHDRGVDALKIVQLTGHFLVFIASLPLHAETGKGQRMPSFRFAADSSLEGAVSSEPVSGVRFPGYWEKIQGISAESQQERF